MCNPLSLNGLLQWSCHWWRIAAHPSLEIAQHPCTASRVHVAARPEEDAAIVGLAAIVGGAEDRQRIVQADPGIYARQALDQPALGPAFLFQRCARGPAGIGAGRDLQAMAEEIEGPREARGGRCEARRRQDVNDLLAVLQGIGLQRAQLRAV